MTTAKPNKQLLSLSFCNYPSSNIQSGGLPCRTGSSSGISLTRELMNGQLKDGGARLLMPVIKCKIRGDGKGGTRPRRGERRATNYKLGKYDSWTEKEREGERVLLAREANKAFVPASSLDTQIKSFCREPGLFPLYANQRHTAAR